MPVRGVILIAYFVASLPVCFLRPFYGVVMWMVVAFVNPQSYTWGAAMAFPWAVAVGIPTLLGMVCFTRGWNRLFARESILLMIFWAWVTVTTLVSVRSPVFNHHAADTWYKWGFVSKVWLMTFATSVIIRDFHQFHIFMRSMALCFGVFVVKSFPFIIMTAGGQKVYGPPQSMIADNNDFGLALNMTLPLFFFFAQIEKNAWLRRVFWALFAMTIPAIFCTYSRGALVGLIAVMGLMLLQSRQRLLLIPAIVLGVTLAAAFAPDEWKDRMNPRKEGAIDKSAQSRINAWTFSWRLACDYPLTGGGFATFTPTLFRQYAPNSEDVFAAHSIYFQVLAEHGFVGIFLFLTMVAACLLTARKLVKRARDEADMEVVYFAEMIRFAMVGFMISGLFLGRAYFDYFFSLVSALVVLKDVAYKYWNAPVEEDEQDEEEYGEEPEPAVSPA
jgi:probable O-glycosylation ligase (exosortase A-associated)